MFAFHTKWKLWNSHYFLLSQAEGTEMTNNYNWLLCPNGQYGLHQWWPVSHFEKGVPNVQIRRSRVDDTSKIHYLQVAVSFIIIIGNCAKFRHLRLFSMPLLEYIVSSFYQSSWRTNHATRTHNFVTLWRALLVFNQYW